VSEPWTIVPARGEVVAVGDALVESEHEVVGRGHEVVG